MPGEVVEIEVVFPDPVISALVGPQGIQGIQGIQGVDGPTGPTGPGVPAGGTSGQLLAKASGTDYDAAWINAGAGTGDVIAANNLSDLTSASTARTNLGLGTAATTDATDYATAAQVVLDPTGLIVLGAADLQTAYEQTDSALVSSRSTGLRNGGDISNLGSGVIRITAGQGSILDNTIPTAPTYCSCAFAQTDIDLSGGGATAIYYIYVDVNGDVLSTTTAPTTSTRRQNIYLWRVSVISGLYSASTSICNPLQQYGQGIADVFEALGLVRSGLVVSAASTDLTLAVSAGSIYQAGANFHASSIDPNKTTYTLKSPSTFRLFTQNNTQGSDRTTLDVANYDVGGTVTAIPGSTSRAQIWTVLQFPSANGEIRIAYGQTYYASISAAQTELAAGTYSPVLPSPKLGAIVIGYIITAANATNLADGVQIFVTTNRFGLLGGAISSSGATPLLAANNLSDLASASAARTNLGLVIGTNVQAYDADLTTWAGITPSGGVQTALPVDIGTNGAVILRGGDAGAPSDIDLSNAINVPAGNVTGVIPAANLDLTGTVKLAVTITGKIGGTSTDLDSLTTAGATPNVALGQVVLARTGSNSSANLWYLRAGTDAEDVANGIVRPDDYAATTNEKVFELIL